MRVIEIILITFGCNVAFAQQASTSFYRFGLLYSLVNYEEPGVMTEKGGNGGVEAEIGYGIGAGLSLSAAATYWDGRLFYDGSTFGGTPVKTITNDYVSDVRLNINLNLTQVDVTLGYGRRSWYDDLVISYRRRTDYTYVPLRISYSSGFMFYGLEYDFWISGKNKSYMSDVGGGRSDVELAQNTGKGFGVELGWRLGTAPVTTVLVKIHKWDIAASETASDGVSTLVEPNNNTLTYTFGMNLTY